MKLCLSLVTFLLCSCSSLSWLGFDEEEEKSDYEKMNDAAWQNALAANNPVRIKNNTQVLDKVDFSIGTAKVVDIDPKKVEALKKKAMQGDLYAQYQMGLCYKYGYGMKYSKKSALYWLKKSADQGHLQAKKVYFHLLKSPTR
ncbi:MAG: hypothetical protein MK132_02585 [Lentisphaerales bacterium]|nr:hypothetical protein [Lentisphaerales bacterium]